MKISRKGAKTQRTKPNKAGAGLARRSFNDSLRGLCDLCEKNNARFRTRRKKGRAEARRAQRTREREAEAKVSRTGAQTQRTKPYNDGAGEARKSFNDSLRGLSDLCEKNNARFRTRRKKKGAQRCGERREQGRGKRKQRFLAKAQRRKERNRIMLERDQRGGALM